MNLDKSGYTLLTFCLLSLSKKMFPINVETLITKNNRAFMQDSSRNATVNILLDENFKVKGVDQFISN